MRQKDKQLLDKLNSEINKEFPDEKNDKDDVARKKSLRNQFFY